MAGCRVPLVIATLAGDLRTKRARKSKGPRGIRGQAGSGGTAIVRHRIIVQSVLALALSAPAADAAVRLVIVAGQSNAVGRGANPSELPDSLRAPRDDIPFRYAEGPLKAVWDPARLVRSDALVGLAYQSAYESRVTLGGVRMIAVDRAPGTRSVVVNGKIVTGIVSDPTSVQVGSESIANELRQK